jgi:hypothetical protein
MPKAADDFAKQIAVRLSVEDLATLEALSQFEKLTLADEIRRAIRHYAQHLGVDATQPKLQRKARK